MEKIALNHVKFLLTNSYSADIVNVHFRKRYTMSCLNNFQYKNIQFCSNSSANKFELSPFDQHCNFQMRKGGCWHILVRKAVTQGEDCKAIFSKKLQFRTLFLFNPLYLGNGKSYIKSDGIHLKTLSKGNPMKKIPSKLDKNFKIYISYKNTVFGPFDPFFPKWLPIAIIF